MTATAASAASNVSTPYFGAYPEALHTLLAKDRTAVERERELCAGGHWRFDPGLLLRVEDSGWGNGPAPQRLLYHTTQHLVVVSDRPELLERLVAAGPVAAVNGRIQLRDRLLGWIARRICEAVDPGYDPGADNGVPERWAQGLVVHYLGTAVLSPAALEGYRDRKPVNASTAGADAKGRDLTPVLDRIRYVLQGEPAPLAACSHQLHLLDAIARGIAAGLLQRGGADSRQTQRMVLGATADYQIEPARR
jgi:hypothetical protein